MKDLGRFFWLAVGLMVGGGAVALYGLAVTPAEATGDHSEDYILCTGTVSISPRVHTDGVWLLDYRSGKLLGSVVDRNLGRLVPWAEVDLVREFNVQPKTKVHFMMATGAITQGQAALYLTETTTGQVGVYTMGSRTDGRPGVLIVRHDLQPFRKGG
jgi:hypothetical protein